MQIAHYIQVFLQLLDLHLNSIINVNAISDFNQLFHKEMEFNVFVLQEVQLDQQL